MKLLQFKASWCGPCKEQASILEGFDTVPVESIDIDEQQDAAMEYGVQSIPTLILLDGGSEVERWTGVTQVDEIETEIRNS